MLRVVQRLHTRIFFMLFSLFVCLCCHTEAISASYALLIGIDDYSKTSFPSLKGCRNDVRLIRHVLLSRFHFAPSRVTMLEDADATHERVLAELDRLRRVAKPEDVIYIHYSGHGSLVCDFNGDEGWRGMDSSLVTYGSRHSLTTGAPKRTQTNTGLNEYDVLDDELERYLGALSVVTKNIVFVADACHSGTITRHAEGALNRSIPPDTRLHPAGFLPPLPPESPRFWVGIGATRDTQKAVEYHSEDGTPYGAFTFFWAKALLSSEPQETWLSVFQRTRVLMQEAQLTQQPQLEGHAGKQLFSAQKGTDGASVLSENICTFMKKRSMFELPGSVEVSYLLFAPVDETRWEELGPEKRVQWGDGMRRGHSRTLPATTQQITLQPGEDMLLIEARNTGNSIYHVYAVNMTEEGHSRLFVPNEQHPVITDVLPGETRRFREGLLFTESKEYVRIMLCGDGVELVDLQQQNYADAPAGQRDPVVWGTAQSVFVLP